MSDCKIPPIPTKCHFEEGYFCLEILKNCGYDPQEDVFVGGDWSRCHFKTSSGTPAWIKLEGDELVVHTLINAAIDSETGYYVGGEDKELLRLKVLSE